MLEPWTHEAIGDLDPVVISAPVIRSGTTLLQRLLCSSRRALIYGELCAQDLDLFVNLYTFKRQQYRSRQADFARGLQQVLAGDVGEWIPDLMPDIDEYLTALGQSAFAGIAYCRDYAARAGRPVWGFKHPAWPPATIRLLRGLLPRARWIFIHRDLVDCLKSAKAQGEAASRQELAQFCQGWANNLTYLLGIRGDPAVLTLRYETLVAEPEPVLRQLTEFTGLEDLDARVLQRKVNAFAGEDFLAQAPGGYAPPAELDDAEMELVQATAGGLREQRDTATAKP